MTDGHGTELIPVADTPVPPGSPEWLESTLNVTPGRDPLGFQTITTDRIIPRLVPGVLALSRRARYLSFYAFLMAYYRDQQMAPSNNGLSEFMKRREFELSLAIQLCPNGCGSQPVSSVGRERAGPLVNRGLSLFPRGESVQSYLGGYGLYYRSPMVDLGLVAPRGTPFSETEGATTKVDVLWPGDQRAAALAAAFDEATRDTEYRSRYFSGTQEIPKDVLIEYSTRACLCRLPEHLAEREALRAALLEPSERQPLADVTRRREAFAFLLWLADRDERVVRYDGPFRAGIWDTHERGDTTGSVTLRTTGARWAALIAKEFAQEAISSIWQGVCRAGLNAMAAAGPIASDDLDTRLLAPLIVPTTLKPFDTSIIVDGSTSTLQLASEIHEAVADHSLEATRAWAVGDGSALAGLGLLLAVEGRVRALGAPPPGWNEVAMQGGERQPGLAQFTAWLAEHLKGEPTVHDTMAWLIRAIIIWPHEAIAYSKLPELTFRFRWESGRLRFFDLRPERFGLTDIRRDPLGRLAADVGLLTWTVEGAVPTEIGQNFAEQVLA